MQDKQVRLHRFEPASRVNGPGMRAVIWVQGCALGCPGCFNPETHDRRGGEMRAVEELAGQIISASAGLEGLTISGGEPMYQHRALARLLELIRKETALSVLVFSGFRWDEIQRMKNARRFLDQVDVLIAGRYEETRRVAGGLIGSANKTVHFFTSRYTQKDLEQVPQAEIILSPNGEIILSGIDPLKW